MINVKFLVSWCFHIVAVILPGSTISPTHVDALMLHKPCVFAGLHITEVQQQSVHGCTFTDLCFHTEAASPPPDHS